VIELVNENINKADIDHLIEWLQTHPKLTKGGKTLEFEKKWSEYIGCKHSVFVNSGSSANLLSLSTLKFCHDMNSNKVVLPTLCWLTDYSPLIQLGIEPIFCDINLSNLSYDLNKLYQVLDTHRPSAIMLVSVLGLIPNLKEIRDMCTDFGVSIIGDYCEAYGSKYKNILLGAEGDFCSTFSTYYGHHLSTIEGGMICTNSDEIYENLLIMRSHGWLRELDKSQKEKYSMEIKSDFHEAYTFFSPGYNLRSTDLQAYMGIRQLDKSDNVCNTRNLLFNRYLSNMTGSGLWVPQVSDDDFVSAFAYPIILPKNGDVEKTYKVLLENEVQSRPLISGSMPAQPVRWSGGGCPLFFSGEELDEWKKNIYKLYPKSKIVDNKGMYVPCHPGMTVEDVDRICDIIKKENL
jgi:CDP-6-deoxy-D-xylo-4-hexulose-3-dehydrase